MWGFRSRTEQFVAFYIANRVATLVGVDSERGALAPWRVWIGIQVDVQFSATAGCCCHYASFAAIRNELRCNDIRDAIPTPGSRALGSDHRSFSPGALAQVIQQGDSARQVVLALAQ
jgi:hypothetical protein